MQLTTFIFIVILFLGSLLMTYAFLTSKQLWNAPRMGKILGVIFIVALMGTINFVLGKFAYDNLFEETSIRVEDMAKRIFDKFDRNPMDNMIDLSIDSAKSYIQNEKPKEGWYEDFTDGYLYERTSIFRASDADSSQSVSRDEFLNLILTLDENKDGYLTSTESLWHHWNGIKLPNEIKKINVTYPQYQKALSR